MKKTAMISRVATHDASPARGRKKKSHELHELTRMSNREGFRPHMEQVRHITSRPGISMLLRRDDSSGKAFEMARRAFLGWPRRGLSVAVVLMVLTLGNSLLTAGEPDSSPASPKFKLGFIERFRFEGWDNSVSLTDDKGEATGYIRQRASLMAQWFPNRDTELAVKLTNEFRYYLTPKNTTFNFHEIIFDQLYFKWKNPGKLPLILTLGRQNITLGEGFVVMDGNPLDGSRAIYFNAARVDYQFKPNHLFSGFFLYQPKTDTLLPVINDRDQAMIEQPEQGLGLYYAGKLNKTGVEAYIIRKDIDDTEERPISSGINTLGVRVTLPLTTKLSFTVEGAYQFGTWGDFDRKAQGGYFHLDYRWGDRLPLFRILTFGGIYLTGDDPHTQNLEAWDPIFSRWPKWSESYIYTLVKEKGPAYWSNLHSLYFSLLMDITKPMTLQLTWHHLTADEVNPASFPGGTGKTRGDLVIGKVEFRINQYTTGHFLWEYFKPGNFYFEGADPAHWIRFELMFKI